MKIANLLPLLPLFSCAGIHTIGLKKYNPDKTPRHIVWFQVAGLASEHLAMLRFSLSDAAEVTSFENHLCLGQTWSFNLFKIRPTAQEGFLSQQTGSKNIKEDCSDYERVALWDHLGWKAVAIAGADTGGTCKEQRSHFYRNAVFWKQQDTRALWEEHFSRKKGTLLIIRDFEYLAALRENDVRRARKVLEKLEKWHAYFARRNRKKNEILLVVSGSQAYGIEFPQGGKGWAAFEKKGGGIVYRNSALLSPVYASGPWAENFCGIFEESQMLKRFLWRSLKFPKG